MEQQDRNYVRQSVSLRRDQIEDVKRIAEEDKHMKFSRVIQEAVDSLIERRAETDKEAA